MTLKDGADIAVIVQAVGFLVSLFFLWNQIKLVNNQISDNIRLNRANNTQNLFNADRSFSLTIAKNAALTDLWENGLTGTLKDTQKKQYETLLLSWLTLHNNAYHQNSKGLLDGETWVVWEASLRKMFDAEYVQDVWEISKELNYEKDFVNHVDNIIAAAKKGKESGTTQP